MTIDSFIQIAALIVAIYALVSRARQLELRIRIGIRESLIGIIYLIAISYLLFYGTFYKIGLAPNWPLEDILDLTPSATTFPITILYLLFLWWRLQTRTVSRNSIFRFQELAEDLLQREEYPELISLLDRYWESLLKIYQKQFALPQVKNKLEKVIRKIDPDRGVEKSPEQISNAQLENLLRKTAKSKRKKGESKETKRREFRSIFNNMLCALLKWPMQKLPDYQVHSETAGDLIRAIMSNKAFIEVLSRVRPYFFIRILESGYFPGSSNFFDLYLKSLLHNPQSILYYELSNIQRSSSKQDKEIPKSNRLLHFLLNDAKKAESMSVWKPIGDEVLKYLEERSKFPDEDTYNFSINEFDKDEMQRSPILIGIQFFDVMVTRALYQGVEWHMWLYYFPHFVAKIVRNYKPHSSVDLSIEWPTKYSYLLYEIIKVLEGWIEATKDLVPSKQSNVVLNNTSNYHENGNIPKSSIIALGFCLDDILSAKNVPERFKQYLMDIVFRLYFELRKNPVTKDYGKVLFSIFKSEGMFSNSGIKSQVLMYFQRTDQIPYRMQCPELVEEFLAN